MPGTKTNKMPQGGIKSPTAAPAEVGSWASCCDEGDQKQQNTSALTALKNLPSAWKPSRMPEAFHKALGGVSLAPHRDSAVLKGQNPFGPILDSHFFEYAKAPMTHAEEIASLSWRTNNWLDLDAPKKKDEEDEVAVQWEVEQTRPDSPFERVQKRLLSQPENIDKVDSSSWVLGSKYLNCMIGKKERRTLIKSRHFFRPSDVYTTVESLQPTKNINIPETFGFDIAEALKREYSGTGYGGALVRLLKAFKRASRFVQSVSETEDADVVSPVGGAALHRSFLFSSVIVKQLLLRRMNKMDADYLRNVVTPAVEEYCQSLRTTESKTSAGGFLQVPAHRSGVSAAAAESVRVKMSPAPGRDASRVADESSDISDGAEDDEVELEQLTTNLLQHFEKLQDEAEAKNHSADGVAAGEGSDGTGRDELQVSAVPAAWPTASIGGADVGRASKTRWGAAIISRKTGVVGADNPQHEPEPSKDLLASQGDVTESDHEQEAIEEN